MTMEKLRVICEIVGAIWLSAQIFKFLDRLVAPLVKKEDDMYYGEKKTIKD